MATRLARVDVLSDKRPPASVFGSSPSLVAIGGSGHDIGVTWNPVDGATRAEVSSAVLTLHPEVVQESTPDAPVRASGNGWIVTVPPNKRVKTLALHGFKQMGGNELTTSLPGGMRIAVAFPKLQGGGFESPRFAVPSVGPKGEVPSTLTGAAYSNRALSLNPAVAAGKVRFALVTGDNPLDFSDQATELDSVDLTTHATAHNASVVIDEGEAQWQIPEFDPDAPAVEVDLRAGIETALNGKLNEGQPLQVTVNISADDPAKIAYRFASPHGFLVRMETGILKAAVEGDPVPVPIATPLSNESPASVTGDLTVHYSGVRILETVSDALPVAGAAFRGFVVGGEPALHVFPPEALRGVEPARIGVYGRAPEDCELSLEFVQAVGGLAGKALAPPAVLKLAADNAMSTRWVAVPGGTRIDGPAGLRVRANRGRFYWVTSSDHNPIVRVAIDDPDPGGRPVTVGGAPLVHVVSVEQHISSFSFPADVFRGPVPLVESSLFLTIDFSDLTLRYRR